ncbi:MAG: hypothetical protein WCQ97_10630 [Aminobacterium sp.]
MPNEDLIRRIEELEEKLKKMEEHQHLGLDKDGSKKFDGETPIEAKEINIHGAGEMISDFTTIPFKIFDSKRGPKRGSGMGIATFNEKESINEQTQLILVSSKKMETENLVPTNRTDFNNINYAQITLSHNPQYPVLPSGPSSFPPWSFLYGNRTPVIVGTGRINGNILTDITADYKNNLAGSYLVLVSTGESRKIISNTSKIITVSGNFTSSSGNYSYQVVTPIFLGAANVPFTRLYVGDDIRLGYGSSGGAQVQYIKWGSGSPEGVVKANVGSLYLRSDGSTDTTLYIKTSGTGNTGWTAK